MTDRDFNLESADQFEVTVTWTGSEPMYAGRPYVVEIGGVTVSGSVTQIKYRVDADTAERLAATKLDPGEVAVCALSLQRPVAFAPYRVRPAAGSFSLIDRQTDAAVGTGRIEFALRRSHTIRHQNLTVDKAARAVLMAQRPCVIWLTGLSGAGKSTIANLVETTLHGEGRKTYLLDGDNVRGGLNRDLGFTAADRVENIRRVAEVARLMADAGLLVLVSFISPFRNERQLARDLVGADEFLEVYVNTPLEIAAQRDPKGLYAKARRGELKNFTGIDSPYEPPTSPDLEIITAQTTPEQAAATVVQVLRERGFLDAG